MLAVFITLRESFSFFALIELIKYATADTRNFWFQFETKWGQKKERKKSILTLGSSPHENYMLSKKSVSRAHYIAGIDKNNIRYGEKNFQITFI